MRGRILRLLNVTQLLTMRLIHCDTLRMEEFFGSDIPEYAILSHTWATEEVSFTDFTTDLEGASLKAGFRKIDHTCRQAIADGLEYAWVDTSCIDKRSSAELSEAINSMFTWYKHASVCYAYLSDVTELDFHEQFPQSRWFQRGWTLQELIAPEQVIFLDSAWNQLGDKRHLAGLINSITRIPELVLTSSIISHRLDNYCIAERMAWASQRKTTRVEDLAYCLLGIFDVNMPLLYGEGEKAFLRLQQEIMKVVDDDSILAWGRQLSIVDADMFESIVEDMDDVPLNARLFAHSPADFIDCHHIDRAAKSISPYTVTNQGLNIELPLVRIVTRSGNQYSVGLLSCRSSKIPSLLGILLEDSTHLDAIMERVTIYADNPCTGAPVVTLLVGPRFAAQAVPTSIIITNPVKGDAARESVKLNQKIIVDRTKQFQDLGYVATGGKSLLGFFGIVYEPTNWDMVDGVFTVKRMSPEESVVFFTFKNKNEDRDCSGFSVIVRGSKAIVRNGVSSTLGEQLTYRGYSMWQDEDDDILDNVVLISDDGRKWVPFITVSSCTRVAHWEIRKVILDVIDVTDLTKPAFLSECRRRRKQDLAKTAFYKGERSSIITAR
jgi:hypothetical protein